MASAEAMAFGLPCVGFDLPAYDSYYPFGMIKVDKGNLQGFAQKIIDLLTNKKKYNNYSKQALEIVNKNWSWDRRCYETLQKIIF